MSKIEADRVNEFGQPIGAAMDNWTSPPFPPHKTLSGDNCQIEPLKTDLHARDFWNALSSDTSAARWTYMLTGPFQTFEEFEKWCLGAEKSRDPQHYAIVVDGHAVGLIAYMRIVPTHGVIETGNIHFSPLLSRTRAATEALYLMAANAFQLGYRRLEWKCDSFNKASRAAAPRFGFTYEGIFRQAIVYKGRTRDTAWYSMLDRDWNSGLKDAYLRWLTPNNFDDEGVQKLKLSELTAPFVYARS